MALDGRHRPIEGERLRDGEIGLLPSPAGRSVASVAMRAKTGDAPRPTMTIAGTGTSLVAACFLADAFERGSPWIRVGVQGSMGSAAMFRAVADGLITMAVTARVPIEMHPHAKNIHYLKVKKSKLGHMLEKV